MMYKITFVVMVEADDKDEAINTAISALKEPYGKGYELDEVEVIGK